MKNDGLLWAPNVISSRVRLDEIIYEGWATVYAVKIEN